MLTHADLKGVNDKFHDLTTDEKGNPHPKRTDYEGITRSFGDAADFLGAKIQEYIDELQQTQPILPVTQLPKASTIDKAITEIKSDGTTNIPGVYKDKDGLIVIKYNELENDNLNKIGFPINSKTKGIKTLTELDENVDTGNIKFLVHGLDFPNQLAKFYAFALSKSDALLSVSYAERPESKFRFFRPQGILLNCDTKNIHGGGETDAGSGYQKNIEDFINNYCFGAKRESDRKYISDLIKSKLELNNEDYIKFVNDNENKSMQEIDPIEKREELIKAFANINSNERNGNRRYNEMYVTNPKLPMGVFAYSLDEAVEVKNPLDFLQKTQITPAEEKFLSDWHLPIQSTKERTQFLREYAIANDLPFIVFGD